jgi:hypothetical protein
MKPFDLAWENEERLLANENMSKSWQKKSPRRKIQDLLTDLCYPKSNWSFLHQKRKFTSAWVARQKRAGFEQKQSWKRRYATKMGACEVWAVSTSRLPKLKPKEQIRQRRKIRFCLTRWNVLDSILNYLEQFQTEKIETFQRWINLKHLKFFTGTMKW